MIRYLLDSNVDDFSNFRGLRLENWFEQPRQKGRHSECRNT
jgi:hypothetical protein